MMMDGEATGIEPTPPVAGQGAGPSDGQDRRTALLHASTHTVTLAVTQVLGLIRGTVVAGTLGPSTYGIWTGLSYLVAYSPYSNLGMFTGMSREYSIAGGRRDRFTQDKIRDSAFSFGMSMAAVVFVGSLLAALVVAGSSTVVRVGFVLVGLATLLDRYFWFHLVLFRLDKKVADVNRATLLVGILYSCLTLALLPVADLYAVLIALPVSIIPGAIYLRRKTTSPFRFSADRSTIKRLISVGLPIDAVGLLDTLSQTAGGMIALVWLTSREVGFYGISLVAVTLLLQVPTAVSGVTNPYLLESYADRGSVHDTEWYSVRLTRSLALLMPFLVAASLITIPPLIERYLPAYRDGLPTMELMLVAAFFYGMGFITANFLIAVEKQRAYATVRAGVAAFNLGLIFLFLSIGWELEGIAWAYLISGAALAGALVWLMMRSFIGTARIIIFGGKLLSPLGYALGCVLLVRQVFHPATAPISLVGILGQLSILSLLYAPLLLVAYREHGLVREARERAASRLGRRR